SHGFVAHKSDTKEIIISFRGTKTITDWITDADFALHDWPSDIRDSKVHKGFLEAYTSVSVQVKSAVLGLIERYPDYSVVFTGHSLGGAQAAIALTDFLVSHANYKSKLSLYTYGQPRTGNGAFAGWLSAQGVPIYRTTYHYDIVPHIPPKILGYAHHTQEAYYAPNSNSAVLCGSSSENKSCSDGALFFKLTPADHKLY
ncbi:alpha/beta-hydrolase, partial [Martensiomyces pterosporus]